MAAMNSPLRVRSLTVADLAFADSVRALAGWNQTFDDWHRFLAADPEDCFLAEWNGAPAGTATTTFYAPELAWIGMVLVHPDYRRRGIARALLQRCIEYLRGRGARCIKLDATPLGKQVYDELGFKDEWTLTRWECAKFQPLPSAHDPRVRGWREADARKIEPFDSQAFGACREGIVQALARQSRRALALEDADGSLAGYGLMRNGSQALYLGPVAATSADGALQLIRGLLARGDDERIFWDIPDPNHLAANFAQQHGFTAQRALTRMYLGENAAPGDARKQFALAGPELG